MLFNVSQRHIDNIRKTSQWVFKMFEALLAGLKSGFLPSFYLPRMNLLACYAIQIEERLKAIEFLQNVFADIKKDPEALLKYTGFGTQKENDIVAEQLKAEKENEQREQADENKGQMLNGSARSHAHSKASSRRRNTCNDGDKDSEKYSKTFRSQSYAGMV